MDRSKTATWTAGSVLVAFLIMVAAWLLLISPRLSAVSETEDQVGVEEARISQLQFQLAGLRDEFEGIDELQEDLEDLRVQIPTDVELTDLTRQITDLAQQSQIFVVALNPGTPLPVVAVGTPVVPDETGEGEGAGDVAATPAALEGFYVVPLEIRVLGGFATTLDFLARLQASELRLVLVTQLNAMAQEASGAQAGRPAVAAGDLETTISAFAYVLLDRTQVDDESDEPGSDDLPVPSDERNPFAPAT